ncbi:MAG: hypothetical protein ACE5FU_12095, partial [Nitrospinota bacterium]
MSKVSEKRGLKTFISFFIKIGVFSSSLLLYASLFTGCKPGAQKGEPGMIFIEAGKFKIGSDEEDTNALAKEYGSRHGVYFENERPVHIGTLTGFFIDET